MQRPHRSEVRVDETWNLADLFASHADWDQELTAIWRDMPSVAQYRGRIGEGSAILSACLDAQEDLSRRLLRAIAHSTFRLTTDNADPVNQADSGRVEALVARILAAVTFIKSEVLSLPDGTLEHWLDEDPSLAAHRVTLRNWLDLKPHALLPETEAALASLSEVLNAPARIYSVAKSVDMTFAPVSDAQGQVHPVHEEGALSSPDPELRRRAEASFSAGLSAFRHTCAATFATDVRKQVVLAKLRRYPSATHMLLHPHRIPVEVYTNILNIIGSELAPHMRRYQRLRQRLLGLDRMLYCDLTAPLPVEDEPVVTFAQAQEWILNSLQVMGEEYHGIIRRAFAERWIDRASNEGKRSGAYCNTVYGVHSYVFMTWADRMRSAFTLTHELGHAGHFSLASRYQRLGNVYMPMSFIEAPSTLNELLLGHYLLEHAHDPVVRRSAIVGLMGTFHHNFVNHLLEGELQRRVYEVAERDEPVTANLLTQTKGEILSEFWNGTTADPTVEIDAGARLLWMRQPHYYMGLYPYTYALGLTIATAAAQTIKTEGQPAVARWLEVLKAGGTLSPVELARLAGVDITRPEPIRQAVAFVGSLVDELERI